MASTFFEYYYDNAKQFTAGTRNEKYDAYHLALNSRHSSNQTLPHDSSTADRITELWGVGSNEDFYLFASQIYEKVQLDAQLLATKDKILLDVLKSVEELAALKALAEYHYKHHMLFLLDHATLPVNRADIKTYRENIQTFVKAEAPAEAHSRQSEENSSKPFPSMYAIFLGIYHGVLNFFKACLAFDSQQFITLLSLSNIYRLLVVFFRLTWKSIWLLGRFLGWLDASDLIAGKVPIDIDILETPVAVFNILSVFLFLGRFIIDSLVSLKHIFFPVEGEDSVNYVERARMEYRKRYGRIWNDLFWSLANSLTNFAMYFHIPLPITGWLLAACLTFDVYWTFYKFYSQDKDYSAKKTELEQKIKNLGSGETNNLQKQLLQLQLRQLECLRVEKTGALIFNMTAALLLPLSFVLLLSLASPVISAPICFFACAFAVAMYITADDFGAAVRASHERRIACRGAEEAGTNDNWLNLSGEKRTLYQAARIQAERDAWFNLAQKFAKTIIIPAVIIGLYTVCWPAAVAATLAYIAFEYRKEIKEQAGNFLTHCRKAIEEVQEDADSEFSPLLTH